VISEVLALLTFKIPLYNSRYSSVRKGFTSLASPYLKIKG